MFTAVHKVVYKAIVMAKISLKKFEELYGVAKSTVWKTAQDAGIDTSRGLDESAVTELKGILNVWDGTSADNSAIIPIVDTRVMAPADSDGRYAIEVGGDVHIHIHHGAADQYESQASNLHDQTQKMITSLMSAARKQGAADASEDDAIYQSVREGRLNQKIAGMLDTERVGR